MKTEKTQQAWREELTPEQLAERWVEEMDRHGVDTAALIAAAAAHLSGKTIVLTGAMVPYAFGSSDGLFNLGSALSFVQVLPPGVYVAMNGRWFPWDRVRKNRAEGVFEAF